MYTNFLPFDVIEDNNSYIIDSIELTMNEKTLQNELSHNFKRISRKKLCTQCHDLWSFATAISMHTLGNLASRGNINADNIRRGANRTINIEDLTSCIIEYLYSDTSWWTFDEELGKFDFSDNEKFLSLFHLVSNYLYSQLTRTTRKRVDLVWNDSSKDFDEIDNKNVEYWGIKTDFTTLFTHTEYIQFNEYIRTHYKKNSDDMIRIIDDRLSNTLGIRDYIRFLGLDVNSKQAKHIYYLCKLIRNAWYECFCYEKTNAEMRKVDNSVKNNNSIEYHYCDKCLNYEHLDYIF